MNLSQNLEQILRSGPLGQCPCPTSVQVPGSEPKTAKPISGLGHSKTAATVVQPLEAQLVREDAHVLVLGVETCETENLRHEFDRIWQLFSLSGL